MYSAYFHHLCYIVTKIRVDEFWTVSQTALPIYYSQHFYPHYPPYLFLTGIPNHAKVKYITFLKALLLTATLFYYTLCFSTFAHTTARIQFHGIRWKYVNDSFSCLYSPRPRSCIRQRTILLLSQYWQKSLKANCLFYFRALACIMITPQTGRQYRFEPVTPADSGTWNALSYSLLYFIMCDKGGEGGLF